MSTDNILNIIINAITEGNSQLLITILLGFFFIWSYNEFRKNYINIKTQNSLDIENSLEQYLKLYFSIEAFQQKNIKTNELFDYFSKAMVYLPKSIVKEMLELNKSTSEIESKELDIIKEKIANEIETMKYKQNTVTTFDYKDNIFEQTSWSFSHNNFDSFILPFVYSFFALTGALSLAAISFIIGNSSGFLRVNFIIFLINTLFSIMLLMYLIDLSFNKILKPKVYIYFALLVILPFCLITFVFNIKYSLINTITLIFFLYIVISKKLLNSKYKHHIL